MFLIQFTLSKEEMLRVMQYVQENPGDFTTLRKYKNHKAISDSQRIKLSLIAAAIWHSTAFLNSEGHLEQKEIN